MSNSVQKSAINVLDEFCKRKLQPPAVYTFISEGSSDCTVESFNETKTVRATSKKKAKHAAAQSLINHLRNLESFKFDLIFLNVTSNAVDETKVSSSTTNEKKRKATAKSLPEINYIGKLLEHCVKNKLPPASFDTIEHATNAPSSQIEFCMKCTVNDIEMLGKGSNKKQAKQRAAMEVLKVLMAGQFVSQENSKEPSPKRFKTMDKSKGADTSSESCANAVPKLESKDDEQEVDETVKAIEFKCDGGDDSNKGECNCFSDNDCREIIHPTEVYSVDSDE